MLEGLTASTPAGPVQSAGGAVVVDCEDVVVVDGLVVEVVVVEVVVDVDEVVVVVVVDVVVVVVDGEQFSLARFAFFLIRQPSLSHAIWKRTFLLLSEQTALQPLIAAPFFEHFQVPSPIG